jgi:hypothetical protein
MTKEVSVNVPIQIKSELLQLIPQDLIHTRIQYLINLFKEKYEKLFETQIADQATLLFLLHLSFSLENLKDCSGFEDHLNEFTNDVDSTYFVTTLANYLQTRGYPVELEPQAGGISKRADIRIRIDGVPLYLECKNPRRKILSSLRSEQEPMYNLLKAKINRPCDVFITYEHPLSQQQLEELGLFLESRLPMVTSEGTICDRDAIKIDVTNLRESFQDIGDVLLQMILENYPAAERNPVTIINRNGIAIGFVKTGVSVLDNLERQIKASLRKAPSDAALVVAVQSEYLTGSLDKNIRQISRLFHPKKFTSINGILLANWSYNFHSLIDFNFQYINNPYSVNPIQDIHRLFRRS